MTEQFSAHRPDVELEEILQYNITDALPIQPYRGEVRDQVRLAVQHVLAAGYSKPRTVTTAEQLEALPVDSVVGDWTGRVYQKDAEEEAPEFPWWMTTGDQRRYPAKRITLPATVLCEPQP